MKRILGWGVGVVYLVIAYGAFSRASAGWDASDGTIGFWWTVVTVLLVVASLAAFIGTWIHTQPRTGSAAGAPTP